MPMVEAILAAMPAPLSSSKVKPRPRRFFKLYLIVCPCTIGRRGPAAGAGNAFAAFSARATLVKGRKDEICLNSKDKNYAKNATV